MDNLQQLVMSKAEKWLGQEFDEATRQEVKNLMDNDPKGLVESFYKDLEFGTGGLRGIMGAGTNRMNNYTVGFATQGLANYLKINFPNEEIRVAIAHDSRNNSRKFAERVADIFASNGFKVFLFDELRPTPELSFAIRELHCQSGVMVTASHNPKEYNGYKAYWSDGSQVTSPHDVNIIKEVEKVTEVSQILTGKNAENITILDQEFDEKYLAAIKKLQLSADSVARFHDMKIIYTPLHGAGVRLTPASLKNFGFTNIISVPEQTVLDGNFPTVESPNPENRPTMKMAIDLAEREQADLAMATDPDSDRLGLALRTSKGDYVLLNGNQTLVLLMCYQLTRWAELGRIKDGDYVVKTIVTSMMPDAVAAAYGVKCYNCLTGFKYIAKIIRENEGKTQYIGGGEESFGYLAGDYVRDKDGVSACSLAAEAAAWCRDTKGVTLYEWLQDLYVKFGFYREGLVNVVREGKDGAELIQNMMVEYRANPPQEILGSKVVEIYDYKSLELKNTVTGEVCPIPEIEDKSNVLQWITEDGTKVSVRPSGTEPKIKFYFGVKAELPSVAEFDKVQAELDAKIEAIKAELKLIQYTTVYKSMTTKERIAKALAVATDTKVFEMESNILHLAPSIFKEQFGDAKAIVIADKNTWRVAGEEVYNHLVKAGIDTVKHIIQQDEFHAEWCYVMEVEEAAKEAGAIIVSVGSGVINDLCKLASHHLHQQYLTIPTAASVDGYSSFGASISYEGLKQTFDCPAPVAILADVDVIANAPKEMTAAGYADLAAKIPCGAEWMIADIMGTEPLIPEAWHVLQDVLDEQLSNPDGVAACDKDAIAALFEGLTLSGFAMQAARSSRPASCTDHLFSHYLDMTHHTFNGKLQSHGFQVAIGTLTMCAFFDAFLEMDLRNLDVERCVEAWPSLEEEQQRALDIFKDFVSPQLGYKEITTKYNDKETVREQLLIFKKHWPLLKAQYRKQVYPFEKMQECFRKVGAPADPADIGVTRQQLKDMMPFVQLMRWRMNLLDLARRGGFYDELVEKVFGKGGRWEVA